MTKNLIAIFVALALFAPALASAAEDEAWKFRLSPYIWFAGIEGDVSPFKNLPSTPIDISASDALDDTDASFMVILDAKKGRHGILADVFYSDVQSTEKLAPGLNLKSGTKTTMISVAYEYELFRNERGSIDGLAGARWWDIEADLTIKAPDTSLDRIKADNSESWVDPLLGLKGFTFLGESQFYLFGSAVYGGFDINAKSLYELSANLGYQWTEAIGTAIGFRRYDLDYDQNDFEYDVRQDGWRVGLTWAF